MCIGGGRANEFNDFEKIRNWRRMGGRADERKKKPRSQQGLNRSQDLTNY